MSAYAPGSILKGTFGYDQTNVEFFRVLSRSKTGMLRMARLSTVETSDGPGTMTWRCVPGEPTGGTLSRRLRIVDGRELGVPLYPYSGGGWISAWSGQPVGSSCYA